MLTVFGYDPDLYRLSLKKAPKLRRPLSARCITSSPWNKVVVAKPNGKRFDAGILVTTHNPVSGQQLSVSRSKPPCTGEKGVRTLMYPRNSELTLGRSFDPALVPHHLYADRARGPKQFDKNPVARAEHGRGTKLVASANTDHVAAVTMNRKNRESAADALPAGLPSEQKMGRSKRFVPDTFSLLHDTSSRPLALRRKGENISVEARRSNVFERGTALRRSFSPQSGPSYFPKSPFGTERDFDLNYSMRHFCVHHDTSNLLNHIG